MIKYLIGWAVEGKNFGDAKRKFEKDVKSGACFYSYDKLDGCVLDEVESRKVDVDLANDAVNLLGSIIDLLTEIQDDNVATAIVPLLNEVFYQLSGAGLEMEPCSPGLKEGK